MLTYVGANLIIFRYVRSIGDIIVVAVMVVYNPCYYLGKFSYLSLGSLDNLYRIEYK